MNSQLKARLSEILKHGRAVDDSGAASSMPDPPYQFELDDDLGTSHMKDAPMKGKEARTKGNASGPFLRCSYPDCGYTTGSPYDLKRHLNGHFQAETYPCEYAWCFRHVKPFTRKDALDTHLRTVHMKDLPKTKGKKGQQSKQST